MKLRRPSWDQYFIRIAEEVGKRSPCLRRSVGAVLVRNKQILTTGYNGPPKGLGHCSSTGCLRDKLKIPSGERLDLCRAIHAEANAIIQAAAHGVAIEGATLYCTNAPCFGCAKYLINAGIDRIVVKDGYPDELGGRILQEAGIAVERCYALSDSDRHVEKKGIMSGKLQKKEVSALRSVRPVHSRKVAGKS